MDSFSYTINKGKAEVTYEFKGRFDESVALPPIDLQASIHLNLGHIVSLNSYGVGVWRKWTTGASKSSQIFLHEVPALFVKAFNSVHGFLTPQMEVISFYVPYYSQEFGSRKDILYVRDRQFTNGVITHPKLTVGDSNGYEIDVGNDYFKFLK